MKNFTEKELSISIEKMFDIAWHDFPWLKNLNQMDSWFTYYTRTESQEEEFKKWLKGFLKKYVIPWRLDKEVWHFILNYWFKLDYKKYKKWETIPWVIPMKAWLEKFSQDVVDATTNIYTCEKCGKFKEITL